LSRWAVLLNSLTLHGVGAGSGAVSFPLKPIRLEDTMAKGNNSQKKETKKPKKKDAVKDAPKESAKKK
jgi:hypothetical protein